MDDQTTELQRAARVSAAVQIKSVTLGVLDLESRLSPDQTPPESLGCRYGPRGAKYEIVEDGLAVSVSLLFEARDEGDGDVLLAITATFTAVYSLDEPSSYSPDDLQCFAKLNGTYHVWPYWRELVHTMGGRAGLPHLVVPVFRP